MRHTRLPLKSQSLWSTRLYTIFYSFTNRILSYFKKSLLARYAVTFARPAFTEIMELARQESVENLIVKGHSRLGRDRLVVGQLLEEEFDRLGVRYIAPIPRSTDRKNSRKLERKGEKTMEQKKEKRGRRRPGTMTHSKQGRRDW